MSARRSPGVGAGAVYATCVGCAVKWFPDRRGLAVGLTAAGFGAGAALTVIPIREVIGGYGYQTAFFWFGLVQGAIVFVLAWLMRSPEPGKTPMVVASKVSQSAQSYTPGQMLTTPVFWLLYVMFVVVSASGLMATAQIAIVAKDFGVANTPLMLGATTLTVALLVDNVVNGAARPLFGWISDMIGRENTMAIAFGLGGIAYWLLGAAGTQPWAFVHLRRADLLDLGRDFQPVPVDLHRHVRSEIRDRQSLLPLHGQGRVGLPRAARQRARTPRDRQLARRVRRHGDHEFRRGRRWRSVRAEADAVALSCAVGHAAAAPAPTELSGARRATRPPPPPPPAPRRT